ncbi:Outer membrane protein TolC [Methylobacillus rhizosphaerae]|uniref:Outer membrane protein TolC n=2 Tax=Methylobacillus rhizosphaerae TaxID=551994 RepID=A0A238ZNZ5_9PROT|nr:Outer membrane protein TolC [Methylobacillus rhizosphaerae]
MILKSYGMTWLSLAMSCLFLHAHAGTFELDTKEELPVIQVDHDDVLEGNATLSLREVLESAYNRNPEQKLLQALDIEAQASYTRARSMLPAAPAIALRMVNDSFSSGRGEREWEAGVDLPIWLPGQRAARQAVANSSHDGVAASREGFMMQLAGLVRDTIWDIAMQENALKLAQYRLDNARAIQQDVEARFRAGELPRTDTMLAEDETLKSEAARVRADAEVKHARHRYTLLTGLETLPARPTENLASIQELQDHHPLLKAARTKLALAEDEVHLANIEKRENPQVNLGTRTIRGGFDTQFNGALSLSVRIPLDAEVRSAPMLAAANSNFARAAADLERLRLTMETMLHESMHNLEVTRDELEIATRQREIARENLRLARKAFQLGESDLVGLMRVQALATDAERAFQSRQIQMKWDIAKFNQAVGVLP